VYRINARSKLNEIIASGNQPLGAFVMSTDAAVTVTMAAAGFDMVMIDREHGPNDRQSTLNHIRAAEANGIIPIVRVLENNHAQIQAMLDIGAHGIIVPKVNTADEARRALIATKYVAGGRGLCGVVEAGRWTDDHWDEHVRASNEEIVLIPLIETKAAIDNLEEIVAIDGIDFILFGHADLSQDLGLNYKTDRASLEDIWQKSVRIAHAAGVKIGVHIPAGFDNADFGTVVADLKLLVTAAKAAIAPYRKREPEIARFARG
jgi:2-keto-3-deoxy-L-rhamnonate aldolase RhmA